MSEQNESIGLLACGASGGWNVDLVETADGNRRWLDLDSPLFSLAFEVGNLDVMVKALDYLRSPTRSGERLLIGHFSSAAVTLQWDNEESGRCFLVVGAKGYSGLHLVLSSDDARMIADALDQIVEELATDASPSASA